MHAGSSATSLHPTKNQSEGSASSPAVTSASDMRDSHSHYSTTNKPLTENSAAILKHLSAIGGRWAHIRGLGLLLLLGTISNKLSIALSLRLGGGYAARKTSFFLLHVASAPIRMAWTHIVISKPTGRWFWQRIRWRSTPAILLPTATWAAAPLVADILQNIILAKLGLPDHLEMLKNGFEEYERNLERNIAALILGYISDLILAFFSHVPGDIILVRCQAALLSEAETPIVRLDKTFGGRARNGSLGVIDAWRSFGREARRRLAMAWLRALLKVITIWAVFGPLLFAAQILSQRLKPQPK